MRRGSADRSGCSPDVILYSQQSLNLGSAGVREERTAATNGSYAFRYSGLKLVPAAGNNYLLLPSDWAPDARPSILLPRSDSLRLEFITANRNRPGVC